MRRFGANKGLGEFTPVAARPWVLILFLPSGNVLGILQAFVLLLGSKGVFLSV